jgi:two-component sensor histidine kinase
LENFRLILPEFCFDDWLNHLNYASSFVQFQQEIRKPRRLGELEINLTFVKWISATPMAALLCELATNVERSEGCVFIIDERVKPSLVSENRAAMKFLVLSGFFTAIFDVIRNINSRLKIHEKLLTLTLKFVENEGSQVYQNEKALEQFARFRNAPVELAYGEEQIVPLQAFRCFPRTVENELDSDELRKFLRSLLDRVDKELFQLQDYEQSARDHTLSKIKEIMNELVLNAVEHAYLGSQLSTGYVVVFVRARIHNSTLSKLAREVEYSSNRLLNNLDYRIETKQVELIVCDVGTGIFNSIVKIKKLPGGDEGQELASEFVFRESVSRFPRDTISTAQIRGSITGLMHLDQILSHSRDGTLLHSGAGTCYVNHPRRNAKSPTFPSSRSTAWFEGSIFHISIPFGVSRNLPVSENCFDAGSTEVAGILSIVRHNLTEQHSQKQAETPAKNSILIDARTERIDDSQLVKKFGEATISNDNVAIRVERVFEKNLINKIVHYWLLGLSRKDKPRKNANLFIVDISKSQVADVAWLIENNENIRKLRLKLNCQALNLYVFGEDFSHIGFSFTQNTKKDQFNLRPLPWTEKTSSSTIIKIAHMLRKQDSLIFWGLLAELAKTKPAQPIVLKNVFWKPEGQLRLEAYLNLSAFIYHKPIRRTVRRALRRAIALFQPNRVFFADRLAEGPFREADRGLVAKKYVTHAALTVGSISVTGQQIDAASAAAGLIDDESVGYVDLLRIRTFDGNSIEKLNSNYLSALEWNREIALEIGQEALSNERFVRIPGSPFVDVISTKQSTSALSISHFLDNAYTRNGDKQKMFDELTAGKFIRTGHWSYGDKHSYIEIGLGDVLEQNDLALTSACEWIAKRIVSISTELKKLIVVFPNSSLASQFVSRTFDYLDNYPGVRKKLILVPIDFLPQVNAGLIKLSPMSSAALTSAVKKVRTTAGEPINSVFLDTSFTTNKTLRHVARHLRKFKVQKIHALGVVNRSSSYYLENEDTPEVKPDAFWRLEVSKLGLSERCVICAARRYLFSTAKRLQNSGLSELARILFEAYDFVEICNPFENYRSHGLAPYIPAVEEIQTKFLNSTSFVCLMLGELRRSLRVNEYIAIVNAVAPKDPRLAIEARLALLIQGGSGIAQNNTIELVCDTLNDLEILNSTDWLKYQSTKPICKLAIAVIAGLSDERKTAIASHLVSMLATRPFNSFDFYAGVLLICDPLTIKQKDKTGKFFEANCRNFTPPKWGPVKTIQELGLLFGSSRPHGASANLATYLDYAESLEKVQNKTESRPKSLDQKAVVLCWIKLNDLLTLGDETLLTKAIGFSVKDIDTIKSTVPDVDSSNSSESPLSESVAFTILRFARAFYSCCKELKPLPRKKTYLGTVGEEIIGETLRQTAYNSEFHERVEFQFSENQLTIKQAVFVCTGTRSLMGELLTNCFKHAPNFDQGTLALNNNRIRISFELKYDRDEEPTHFVINFSNDLKEPDNIEEDISMVSVFKFNEFVKSHRVNLSGKRNATNFEARLEIPFLRFLGEQSDEKS